MRRNIYKGIRSNGSIKNTGKMYAVICYMLVCDKSGYSYKYVKANKSSCEYPRVDRSHWPVDQSLYDFHGYRNKTKKNMKGKNKRKKIDQLFYYSL